MCVCTLNILFVFAIIYSNLENAKWDVVSLNIEIMKLLKLLVEKLPSRMSEHQWDFLLCSLVSWIQVLYVCLINVCFANPFIPSYYYYCKTITFNRLARRAEKASVVTYCTNHSFTTLVNCCQLHRLACDMFYQKDQKHSLQTCVLNGKSFFAGSLQFIVTTLHTMHG